MSPEKKIIENTDDLQYKVEEEQIKVINSSNEVETTQSESQEVAAVSIAKSNNFESIQGGIEIVFETYHFFFRNELYDKFLLQQKSHNNGSHIFSGQGATCQLSTDLSTNQLPSRNTSTKTLIVISLLTVNMITVLRCDLRVHIYRS